MSHHHLLSRTEKILKEALGESASFREGQWEAIHSITQPGKQLIVVQRTGWGKSLVYFIATRLNRERNRGMTILISPLLSLMRNQIDQASKFGLKAVRIDSTNHDEHPKLEQAILANEVDVLLISPERLSNEAFIQNVWVKIRQNIGILVIDEVHCISDWGHDFRPDYRRVMHIWDELPESASLLGTTATANSRVIEDIRSIIGGSIKVSRGSLMRKSLRLYTYPEPQSTAYRLVLTSYLLTHIEGTGIIYCTTIRDCEIVARWLQEKGFAVEAYHSKSKNREELEAKLINNELKALVASVALGMGFDKPDLSFVIHFQLSGSIISYYQQIGRAGRGIENAHVILMHGTEDREIQEYFITSAFPPIETVLKVAQHFTTHQMLTRHELQVEFNLSKGTAEKMLQHLEIEGFITETTQAYTWSGGDIPDFQRWAAITQQRFQELAQMEAFIASPTCLMRFLADALEDPTHPEKCGRCKNCRSAQSKFAINELEFKQAQTFLLHGDPIWIDPRKQWPRRDMVTSQAKLAHTNERGVALSFYNDDGWGKWVKEGKYTQGRFNDELVMASANLIREHWDGQLQWITNIPSCRHPLLVSDFAKRLAESLGLPYIDALACTRDYPEQKTMQNNYLQIKNLEGAFTIKSEIPMTSVLLVDDIVDSGWSLTLSGWMLRERGVEKVYPFVLAKATGKGTL